MHLLVRNNALTKNSRSAAAACILHTVSGNMSRTRTCCSERHDVAVGKYDRLSVYLNISSFDPFFFH